MIYMRANTSDSKKRPPNFGLSDIIKQYYLMGHVITHMFQFKPNNTTTAANLGCENAHSGTPSPYYTAYPPEWQVPGRRD